MAAPLVARVGGKVYSRCRYSSVMPEPAEARVTAMATPDQAKLDHIVAEARRSADERARGYRERALKMYPWVCGRCAREFTRTNVHELTVHHRNHDHADNP